ncbi:MAG TPA: peptidylprolyl isomerase [Saprospiraceae bacterium]|nr:peptidylprolyl isomerase [Saprospiraceae bacterium]HMP25327.1 peptidylprolyl isomerase [Saprospiraceae bacterium]
MRTWTLIPLLLLVLTSLSAQKVVIDKVVGTVGGELLLLSEVEEQYALMTAQNPKLPADIRCDIMDGILSAKLLLNQAKLDSVEVSDEEVESQLNARIERILSYMNNDLEQFETYYGQSVNEVKEQFREDLRSQILTDRMRGQIMSDVKVTPAEVRAFFQTIPRDSLPYFNSEVEIREIVYKPKINEEERQRAIDKLTELRRRIVENGEDFAELARKFSDDGGSARLGGELGWARRGKFVPEFEAVAYNLDKGEISEIVESEFGFHVLQLLERRGNSINVRHILVKPQITDADIEKARSLLDSVRTRILLDSMSFSLAVKRFGYKNTQSYNNDGRAVNPATGNTFFEIGDLEPDIYFTIDTMKVGGISKPFQFFDPLGEPYFRIVMLDSRTAPHRASLALDYFKIQQAAIESKKNEFINNWVAEKIENTFIHLDAMYDGCPTLEKWRARQIRP